MSLCPDLLVVKKKCSPSRLTDGMYSSRGELMPGPMFTGSVQVPPFFRNAT